MQYLSVPKEYSISTATVFYSVSQEYSSVSATSKLVENPVAIEIMEVVF
jgi:hypothetical protein